MIFESAFVEYIKSSTKVSTIYYVDSKITRKGINYVKFVFNGNNFELKFSKSLFNWIGLLFIVFKNILTKGTLKDDGERFNLFYNFNDTELKVTKVYRQDYKTNDSVSFMNSIKDFKNYHILKFYKIIAFAMPIVIAESIFLIIVKLSIFMKRKLFLKIKRIKRMG